MQQIMCLCKRTCWTYKDLLLQSSLAFWAAYCLQDVRAPTKDCNLQDTANKTFSYDGDKKEGKRKVKNNCHVSELPLLLQLDDFAL